MSIKKGKAPWVNNDISDSELIIQIYHLAYYPLAVVLIEKGLKEAEVKDYFAKAVAWFIGRNQIQQFDENLDLTLYLLTLIQLLVQTEKNLEIYVEDISER